MKIIIFDGKINHKWPFLIAMLVYQRVNPVYPLDILLVLHQPPWNSALLSGIRSSLQQLHRRIEMGFLSGMSWRLEEGHTVPEVDVYIYIYTYIICICISICVCIIMYMYNYVYLYIYIQIMYTCWLLDLFVGFQLCTILNLYSCICRVIDSQTTNIATNPQAWSCQRPT